ncbi:hypothetical protein Acr_28g0010440 [Actinidia rufa]|uniref:Uncharacterized protein n=1 Tax=Actinidia rufa TaxID=165716 RepID=A0A7J0HB85_9ERIC|nr:hypothetical protein Acr_28g0010440 [Actinidia rufa]
MEITRPDLYNNGAVVVHGIQGFVSHLSPISCKVELATSLSFPPPPPMEGFFIMRLMLDDAMLRLRISGFSVLALALHVKYSDLLEYALHDVCRRRRCCRRWSGDGALVVTTRGGEGPLAPMRLNYVKVTSPDLIYNLKIAVHGVARPFPQVNQTAAVELAKHRTVRIKCCGIGNRWKA